MATDPMDDVPVPVSPERKRAIRASSDDDDDGRKKQKIYHHAPMPEATIFHELRGRLETIDLTSSPFVTTRISMASTPEMIATPFSDVTSESEDSDESTKALMLTIRRRTLPNHIQPPIIVNRSVKVTKKDAERGVAKERKETREPSAELKRPKQKPTSMGSWAALFAILAFALSGFSPPQIFPTPPSDPDGPVRPDYHRSVYVPGAGFSGFWYTLGKLRSLVRDDTNLYCFSAGCLAAVSVLTDRSLDDVAEAAIGVQRSWRDGALARHLIVDRFVEKLINDRGPDRTSSFAERPELLTRLRVLTATRRSDGKWGLETSIRTPSTVEELHEYLVQTAWIPIATGNGVYRNGHMDGAFSVHDHPPCAHAVTLPARWDLVLNSLNPNMSHDKLHEFYDLGFGKTDEEENSR